MKKKGVKKIISVGLKQLRNIKPGKSILKVLGRSQEVSREKLVDFQEEESDIPIRIPSQKYSGMDVSKAVELFKLGEKTANKNLKKIKELLEK